MKRSLTLFAALGLLSACSSDSSAADGDADTDPDGDMDEKPSDGDLLADGDDENEAEQGELEIETEDGFDVSAIEFPYCEVDEAFITSIYESLTMREKIGQHFMLGAERAGEGFNEATARKLDEYKIGGVFLNPPVAIALGDGTQTATLVYALKTAAIEATGLPLFVSLDQEGGPNATINSLTGGTDTIGSMPIAAIGDPQVAYEQFEIMGREIAALGFNMDFGPVMDTLLSTKNGNQNTRSFSPNPDLNARLSVAAFAGLQHNLILPTAKHFPGDGILDGNTHRVFVIIEKDREFLEDTILKPFRAAFSAGCDGVMTIPSAYTALDPERSAITSRAITTELLRDDMGFKGLVVTDSLGMEGAKIGLEPDEEPGIEAMRAGADILLYVDIEFERLDRLYTTIESELGAGTLSSEEFEASTRRILSYKQKYCLFERPIHPDEEAIASLTERIALKSDRKLSASHADRSIVLLHDDGVLPLSGKKILYVGPAKTFEDPGSGWLNIVDQTFGDALQEFDDRTESITYMLPFNPSYVFKQVKDAYQAYDVLVLGTLQARFSIEQQQLVHWLLSDVQIDIPIVHVMIGVPFDYFQTRDKVAAAVALMGSRSVMVEAGAKVLYGEIEAEGKMRFDLEESGPDGDLDGPVDGDTEQSGDRCLEENIDCSGQGICIDTGASYGCICYPNWHPSDDGLDCIADGADR